MIIVKNNIIPFKGFKAIYMFGFLFTRGDLTETQLNHEKIHERQAIELLLQMDLDPSPHCFAK